MLLPSGCPHPNLSSSEIPPPTSPFFTPIIVTATRQRQGAIAVMKTRGGAGGSLLGGRQRGGVKHPDRNSIVGGGIWGSKNGPGLDYPGRAQSWANRCARAPPQG